MATPDDYTFVGVGEGLFPDVTVCLSGRLFVAVAPVEKLVESYRRVHDTTPSDLVQVCGHFTQSTISDLQKSLGPDSTSWVFWQILEPGQVLITPPAHVRAEGASIVHALCYIEF